MMKRNVDCVQRHDFAPRGQLQSDLDSTQIRLAGSAQFPENERAVPDLFGADHGAGPHHKFADYAYSHARAMLSIPALSARVYVKIPKAVTRLFGHSAGNEPRAIRSNSCSCGSSLLDLGTGIVASRVGPLNLAQWLMCDITMPSKMARLSNSYDFGCTDEKTNLEIVTRGLHDGLDLPLASEATSGAAEPH